MAHHTTPRGAYSISPRADTASTGLRTLRIVFDDHHTGEPRDQAWAATVATLRTLIGPMRRAGFVRRGWGGERGR